MSKQDNFEHYRWSKNREGTEKCSWKETLEAMCANYGTFSGRWHSNDFWKRTAIQIPSLSEEQCREKVIQIEQEADSELEYWRQMQ